VYSRTIQGRTLRLRPSGWAYKNTFVLMDEETGSLWYPGRKGLKGIQGPHLGKSLPEISSKDTTWEKWERKHPGSKILK
jgi:hypothetical protein